MRYIQCPNRVEQLAIGDSVVFMAGGITGCPDWQTVVVEKCKNVSDGIILVNPRREDFDCSDKSDEFQIKWEYDHLAMADWIYFWFPKEGRCMITLYELGCALGEGRNIRVGVEPGYVRELDVREQLKHRASWCKIYTSLEDLYAPVLLATK